MRVLMVSKACLVGAYQTKLEELARFPDIELTVVVPPSWRERGRVQPLERAYTDGYDLIVEPIVFNGSFHLHFYPWLARRIRAAAPDIVHIDEEPYNWATFHALRLAKRAGARVVWFTWQNLNRTYPFPFRAIEAYNLRHTDYAIAGTSDAANVWREKGYDGPLVVIPQFGVAPDIFAPSSLPRDPAAPFVIGYVGRLVREKGVDVLLRAVARLQAPCRVMVAGAGPEQQPLEALAHRLGLAERVSFVGQIPSTRMPAFYQQLDALVAPSRSAPNWTEQFGRILIEAMACGVAVLGADSGAIPSVVGDAGLTFPEDDIATLCVHLDRLIADRAAAAELGRRGRERVLSHYTQAQVAAQTVAVYRRLLAGAA